MLDLDALELDAIIPLFEISEFNLLSPYEAFYFCAYPGVSFEQQEYQAIDCEGTGYDLVGQGSIANPKLTISNVGRAVSSFLYQLKTTVGYRLEGCTVTRRLTQKKYLDGQPNSGDAIKGLLPDIYQLEQVEEETYQAVKLRLSTPFDLEGSTLPNRMALRQCSWLYRGNECGYFRDAKFTIKNESTLDPKLDICAKTLTACEKRFGVGVTLPFGGFPGLTRLGQ